MCKSKQFKEGFKLVLRAEICLSCRFNTKSNYVKIFRDYLKLQDIHPTVKFVKKLGAKNEFYIFQEYNDTDIIIFSNNKELHPEAVHGSMLLPDHFEEMIEKMKFDYNNSI